MKYLYSLATSDDTSYNASLLSLWSTAESACGYLVVAIPSIPKLLKMLPFTESVIRVVKSLTGSNSPSSTPRRGAFRTWGTPTRRKRRGLWEITELEETQGWRASRRSNSPET